MWSFRFASFDLLEENDGARWCVVAISSSLVGSSSSCPSSSMAVSNRESGGGPHGFSQALDLVVGGVGGADMSGLDPREFTTKSPPIVIEHREGG